MVEKVFNYALGLTFAGILGKKPSTIFLIFRTSSTLFNSISFSEIKKHQIAFQNERSQTASNASRISGFFSSIAFWIAFTLDMTVE